MRLCWKRTARPARRARPLHRVFGMRARSGDLTILPVEPRSLLPAPCSPSPPGPRSFFSASSVRLLAALVQCGAVPGLLVVGWPGPATAEGLIASP